MFTEKIETRLRVHVVQQFLIVKITGMMNFVSDSIMGPIFYVIVSVIVEIKRIKMK